MCTYVCMYACMYLCTCVDVLCAYVRMYIMYVHTYVDVDIYVYMYGRMSPCMYVYINARRMYVSMHDCTTVNTPMYT